MGQEWCATVARNCPAPASAGEFGAAFGGPAMLFAVAMPTLSACCWAPGLDRSERDKGGAGRGNPPERAIKAHAEPGGETPARIEDRPAHGFDRQTGISGEAAKLA